ncbi:MAG: intradiol ring-cleavage dioxygenase [Pirellulaceae bacterium]
MKSNLIMPTRRETVKGMAAGAGALMLPAWFARPGLFAEELTATPSMTEGPFYPDRLPLDTDNDLLIINDSITPAVGEITHLTGRVLSRAGEPVRGALVEIWQVDNEGSYLHSRGANPQNEGQRDANFQGYGRFLTDQQGQYYFRTIKPVTYPGRTPHIHYAVTVGGRRVLTTQMLIKGHELNERDGLFRQIRDPKLRETLLAEFRPIERSRIGELSANWDLVIGVTPEDDN